MTLERTLIILCGTDNSCRQSHLHHVSSCVEELILPWLGNADRDWKGRALELVDRIVYIMNPKIVGPGKL